MQLLFMKIANILKYQDKYTPNRTKKGMLCSVPIQVLQLWII